MNRWRGRAIFNPSITQKVRSTLHEVGRDDLAMEILVEGIKELEEEVAKQERRLQALEQSNRERLTPSGVHKILSERAGKQAINWWRWLARAGAALGLTALGRIIWKGWQGHA